MPTEPDSLPQAVPFTAAELQERLRQRRRQVSSRDALLPRAAAHPEEDARYRRFLERPLRPGDVDRFISLVEEAIARGSSECQVLRFPSAWLRDRGRAVNCHEPGWPSTLPGFAAGVSGYFDRELKDKGFSLRAQIVTWPDGLPGDVALFVGW